MRLAAVPLFFAMDPETAVRMSVGELSHHPRDGSLHRRHPEIKAIRDDVERRKP